MTEEPYNPFRDSPEKSTAENPRRDEPFMFQIGEKSGFIYVAREKELIGLEDSHGPNQRITFEDESSWSLIKDGKKSQGIEIGGVSYYKTNGSKYADYRRGVDVSLFSTIPVFDKLMTGSDQEKSVLRGAVLEAFNNSLRMYKDWLLEEHQSGRTYPDVEYSEVEGVFQVELEKIPVNFSLSTKYLNNFQTLFKELFINGEFEEIQRDSANEMLGNSKFGFLTFPNRRRV